MLISEENILELIPQRYPMVMIDKLVACDEIKAVSQLTIRGDNLFLDRRGFSTVGMMENIAQTAAARTGYLLLNKPGGQGIKAPVGVIGSIKNFRMYFQPPVGAVITTTVSIEHEVLQAKVIKGRIEMDGALVAESDMQIFLTEDQPLSP
jgi:3-hydroxymyristoyl/3-hydroxydecanoyl-(acyl carrier protein) dehydratase